MRSPEDRLPFCVLASLFTRRSGMDHDSTGYWGPILLTALVLAFSLYQLFGHALLLWRWWRPARDPNAEHRERVRALDLALMESRLRQSRLECRRLRQLIREDRRGR
jgi:hypothetical protein